MKVLKYKLSLLTVTFASSMVFYLISESLDRIAKYKITTDDKTWKPIENVTRVVRK